MNAEFAKQDFSLLGITKFYDHGFLPTGRDQLGKNVKDGEAVQKLDEAGYLKHLEKFRENLQVPFPSVVATGDDFKNYKVSGIPTLFVVDREGKIAFVAVGGKKEAMLRMAIRRLLEKK